MATKGSPNIICFAYGSNMLSSRMCAPNRVPSAKPLKAGYIKGYRLTFDKVRSNRWSNFMNYLPQVIAARYVREFIVSTRFDDGTEKYIDISQWFKGPVFEPLRDPKFFKKFFVEAGTLAWPNGVDIAPEVLYAARESSRKGHNKRMERTPKTRHSS